MENFQLGEKLGSGAFGSVYKVKRKEDSKIYAMKIVKISLLGAKERENALNEIRILYSLAHPNIIGYKEAFYDENSKTLNIVMEYADDGDLESKINYNKMNKLFFDESTIWKISIQILKGLKYLHDNNIIHRDLKSANIFLMKNGLIKIGDLNVSKLSKIGSANTHTGTPYYSSPEIWIDKSYNNKTDIWSVGCIIYEMCNLNPPFRGTSLINLYNNIQKGEYKNIHSFYSKELKFVISQMIIVEPNKRFSCDKLLELNVIQSKMKDLENLNNCNDGYDKVDLIQTIKFPKKLKDINKILPQKKKYNMENEMMMNDEFETKKSGFYQKVKNSEVKKNINNQKNNLNKNQNNYNQQHNNFNIGNNNLNKQNNLINNNNNNINLRRPLSSLPTKNNNQQKKILISHNHSHKIQRNNRYQNNYQHYNSNIENHNNIQINSINKNIQNNKVRELSGKRVPNNLVDNRPNNNLINIHEYHSNKLKPNVNKLQMENKNNVKKRAISARPNHKLLSDNNKNINNNNIKNNNNNNLKIKIISSKGGNNNGKKVIIEKYNYKNPISKQIGYKPKIGNRK